MPPSMILAVLGLMCQVQELYPRRVCRTPRGGPSRDPEFQYRKAPEDFCLW